MATISTVENILVEGGKVAVGIVVGKNFIDNSVPNFLPFDGADVAGNIVGAMLVRKYDRSVAIGLGAHAAELLLQRIGVI